MLEKLRSRHSIDLPAEEWTTSKGLLASLGGLTALFLLLPLGLGLYAAIRIESRLLSVGLAIAALFLVLLVAAARGKPAHRRR